MTVIQRDIEFVSSPATGRTGQFCNPFVFWNMIGQQFGGIFLVSINERTFGSILEHKLDGRHDIALLSSSPDLCESERLSQLECLKILELGPSEVDFVSA